MGAWRPDTNKAQDSSTNKRTPLARSPGKTKISSKDRGRCASNPVGMASAVLHTAASAKRVLTSSCRTRASVRRVSGIGDEMQARGMSINRQNSKLLHLYNWWACLGAARAGGVSLPVQLFSVTLFLLQSPCHCVKTNSCELVSFVRVCCETCRWCLSLDDPTNATCESPSATG
jgi:hypothetical protein